MRPRTAEPRMEEEKRTGQARHAEERAAETGSAAEPGLPPEAKIGKKGARSSPPSTQRGSRMACRRIQEIGKAAVGGAHEKEFLTDRNGDKWLFKPIGPQVMMSSSPSRGKPPTDRSPDRPHSIEVRTIH